MKKIFFLGLTLCLVGNVDAQITWDGGGTTNDWSDAINWSGNTVPGSTDAVIFDGTSTKNCNFDIDPQIASLSINSGYTGTIDALVSLPVILGNFNQAAGTFISTSDLSANGLLVGGSISFTGGTFSHNNGIVTLAVTDLVTTNVTGSITFNQLKIIVNGIGTGQRNVNFGTSTTNTLVLNGGSSIYAYQGNINILTSLTISGTSSGNPTSNSGTFTFSGAGPISITGSGAAARNKLPNLVFNTSGNFSMSGHVNVQGSWTGTQGILTAGPSTTNFYGSSTSISGTAAAFDNLTVQSGASVTMPSAEVLIGGTLTRTGTLNFQSGTILGLNGSGAQSISGSAITLGGIHAYTGTRNVTMSTGVTILDFLQVDAGVTFASGGNITLRSDAKVAQSAGVITGNVTVETTIPGPATGWANLGVRGVMGQTVANWDTYVSSSAANGIPMTCGGCAYTQTTLSNWFESVQGWDESINYYDTNIVASTPLTPGRGFWMYVGDGQINTNDLKVINTGSLVQGNFSYGVTLNTTGDNLVANPYPCPISATSLFSNFNNAFNFSGAIYVFNANTSSFDSYSGGAGSGSQGDVIPGGQGFYVEFTATLLGTTLDFDETMKTTSNAPILKPASPTNTIGQLVRLKISNAIEKDEMVFRIHPNATAAYDRGLDAHKIFQSPGYVGYPGSYSKYTTISSKDPFNEDYSIHSIPVLTQSVSIPVLAKVSATGNYSISASNFQDIDPGVCITLHDKLDNTFHNLRMGSYSFNISDTTSTPRFELIFCKDESINPTGIAEVATSNSIFITQDQQGAFVKTAFAQNTKATISVYNIVGQKLMNDISVEGTVTSTLLNLDQHNQVVLIRVVSDKESSTKRIVIH